MIRATSSRRHASLGPGHGDPYCWAVRRESVQGCPWLPDRARSGFAASDAAAWDGLTPFSRPTPLWPAKKGTVILLSGRCSAPERHGRSGTLARDPHLGARPQRDGRHGACRTAMKLRTIVRLEGQITRIVEETRCLAGRPPYCARSTAASTPSTCRTAFRRTSRKSPLRTPRASSISPTSSSIYRRGAPGGDPAWCEGLSRGPRHQQPLRAG